MESDQLAGIGALASKVAALHDDQQRAKAEETAAEVALLEKVIAAAKPALPALASRIQLAERVEHMGDVNYGGGVTTKDYATERGFLVSDDRPGNAGPERDAPGATSGKYEGFDLFLLPDGTFVEACYTGSWSKWQGSSSHWETELTARDLAYVVTDYDLDDIVRRLSAALTSHANGKAPERAKAARERAAKLRAIVELVK